MQDHVIHLQAETKYVEFGQLPVLTSEALHPIVETDGDELTKQDLYRAAACLEHERALERAEQDGWVKPRNPVSFALDSFSFGEHAKKRLVHVDQVRAFAQQFGIEVVVDELDAADDQANIEDNEPMKKKHIIGELRSKWESIESDFREASRTKENGKANGLELCRVPGQPGMYYKKLVVEWAIKNRKLRQVEAAPTSTNLSDLPSRQYRIGR